MELHENDIKRIQALYGKKGEPVLPSNCQVLFFNRFYAMIFLVNGDSKIIYGRKLEISRFFFINAIFPLECTAQNMPEDEFSLPRIFRYNDINVDILCLYGKIRVIENPYSGIIYAVNGFRD